MDFDLSIFSKRKMENCFLFIKAFYMIFSFGAETILCFPND